MKIEQLFPLTPENYYGDLAPMFQYKSTVQFIKFLSLFVIISSFTACLGCEANRNKGEVVPDVGDTSVDGGSDFNPVTPTGSENEGQPQGCIETGSGPVQPSALTLDFGLNQVGTSECQTISLNTCTPFTAQIQNSTAKSTVEGSDGEEATEKSEFVIKNGSDESENSVSGLVGSVEICYKRYQAQENEHTGKVSLIVGEGSHVFVVSLKGQTLPPVFKEIQSPQNNLILWEESGQSPLMEANDPDVPYFKFFPIETQGSLDVENYSSLITDRKIRISVTNGGITSFAQAGEDGAFSQVIQIPNATRVYPVNFTVGTSKGELTVTRNVIRFGAPEASVEIRNQDSERISVLKYKSEDNNQIPASELIKNDDFLVLGTVISNIDASAPNAQMPVSIQAKIQKGLPATAGSTEGISYLIYSGNGKWVETTDPTREPTTEAFYSGLYDEGEKPNTACQNRFPNATMTHCVPMPETKRLSQGVNKVTIKVCNEYTDYLGAGTTDETCTITETYLVVDNTVPNIQISSIKDAQKFGFNTPIILSGKVQNFKPGSKVENGKCVDSSIKLWINSSIEKDDFYICPTISQGNGAAGNEESIENGTYGNIKEGTFYIDLSKAPYKDRLTTFTNLIRITAENNTGHLAVKVVSFQRGKKSKIQNISKGTTNVVDIISGQLGTSTPQGKVKRSPLMLKVSESALDGSNTSSKNLIAAIEHFLNDPEDGIKFADVVQGGSMPGDEDGDNFEDDDETINFDENLNIPEGKSFFDLDRKVQEQWIWENLHGSMPQKVLALSRYRVMKGLDGSATPGDLENVFFKGQCGDNNPETSWNVACDSCGNKLSTALVTYDTYQYIFKDAYNGDLTSVYKLRPEWPSICGENLNCNTTEQGRWKVGSINLKANGYIDADVCIVGEGDVTDGCDDVPDNNKHKPAYWGHAAAINLIQGGITGLEDDPIIPVLWNVGKLRLNLKDVLQLQRIKLADGTYTNKIVVHKNKLKLGLNGSIKLEPYLECEEYYHSKYPNAPTPWGCDAHGYNYPVVVERTALAGEELRLEVGENGTNMFLQTILRDELQKTFGNMVQCMVSELVNPILDPINSPYKPWVNEADKVDLNLAIDNTDDEVSIKQFKDAENPVFTIKPNLKDANIDVKDGELALSVPFQMGAANVAKSVYNDKLGHMYRDTVDGFEDNYPLPVTQEQPSLSASLNLEEIVNGLLAVVLPKGIKPIIDLADLSELDPPAGYQGTTDWTVGLDKVILGRFDICDNLAGLVGTDLDPSILLNGISGLFKSSSSHWDLILDPNNPPTLFMNPITETEDGVSSTEIQLGLSNIQISIHDLLQGTTDDTQNVFTIDPKEIVRVRLDAIIKLKLRYIAASRRVEIYIPGSSGMPLYISVVNRGPTYNDKVIIDGPYQVLIEKSFGFLTNGEEPSFVIDLPNKASEYHCANVVKSAGDNADTEENTSVDATATTDDEDECIGGLTIQDRTALPENGVCVAGNEPQYSDHTRQSSVVGLPRGFNVKDLLNNKIKVEKQDFFVPKIETLIPDYKKQVEAFAQALNNKSDTDNDDDDPCEFADLVDDIDDNSIKDALCDLGISEIYLGEDSPQVELDSNNGYLHIFTSLIVEVFDELFESIDAQPQGGQ